MTHEDDIMLLSQSPLFDAEWYVAEYPDVGRLNISPEEHYAAIGGALGRYPSMAFDPKGYVKAYPDAAGQNPLLHFLKVGEAAGHSPLPNGLIKGATANDLAPPRPVDDTAKSNFPDAMARRVTAARQLPWEQGSSVVYRDTRAHFDPAFYIAQYYDMAQTPDSFDIIRHYVRAGDKEGRAPNPHFSARGYRRRYGKHLKDGTNAFHHWITEGRRKGMIAHPMAQFEGVAAVLGLDPADCQEKLIAKKNDIRARLEHGVLGEMVNKAAELDPLVSRTWRQALNPNVQPFHRVESAQRLIAIHALQEAAEFRQAKAVVCVSGPRWGSNRRLEGHVTHALAAEYGADAIVFLSLDQEGEMPTHKYPEGVRCINVATLTKSLKDGERERVILEFLRSLRASAYFNVNSATLWKMQSQFGAIMREDVPVVGCFFCNDKSIYGTWGGYPASMFYRHFATMKAVCTDSHYLRNTLIEQFYVPDDQQHKISVLEAPVNPDLPQASDDAPENERPQLFWASRLDLQKRLDVVYEIARQRPDIDIRMWGQTIANGPDPEKDKPENVILEGSYSSFDELPLSEADAWLYTSEWDGVPSILLEVCMTGLPIIGSDVGGTREVLRAGKSWPIAPCDDVDAYIAAIDAVIADPEAARSAARNLRATLMSERTEANYQTLVRAVVEGDQ